MIRISWILELGAWDFRESQKNGDRIYLTLAACVVFATLLPCFHRLDDLISRVKRNSMMKKHIISTLTIFTLILASAAGSSAAEVKPHISDLRLHQGESDVLLSAHLVTELGEEMRKALRGGVPLTFSYRINLTSRGSILGEKIVRKREVVHTLEFDPVKQLYMFTGDGYGKEPVVRTTREEEEALGWLTEILDWPLYPFHRLEKNLRYRVRVMATLRSVELPSVLGYLFFFTSIFNQETPWAQLDFTY